MCTQQSRAVRWLISAFAFSGCLVFAETVAVGGTPPSNDDCANAMPFAFQGDFSSIVGTTGGATLDVVPLCDTTVVSPGVWFSITGNGHLLDIDTCFKPSSPDHYVSVFCGDCTDLHCVGQHVTAYCFADYNVRLCSQAGVEYLILVHDSPVSSGVFSLNITDWGPCTSTDPCQAVGACCTDPVNETCVEVTATDCVALGGAYQGDGTTCSSADCGFATFCDGTDGSLASCPCSNPGSPDTGCDLPQGTGGVGLSVLAQTTNPNGATLRGTGFATMASPTAIVIRSSLPTLAVPVVFGDGIRCVQAIPVVRLAATSAMGGLSTHTFGNGAMAGSGIKHYQLWFRSNPSTYCDAMAAFNLSNGRSLTW